MLLEAAMAELSIILNDEVHESTSLGLFQELGGKAGQTNINAMVDNIRYADDEDKITAASHASTHTISLLQDDHEFASRIINREPSNLGESDRFGYKSTAVAAGGVPFEWEAEPGKPKTQLTIKEEEELPPPLTLPPIRLSNFARSPSSSATQSPKSITGKMKSLLINVKRSGDSTTIITPEPTFSSNSPSKKASPRVRRERKSLSSDHGSLQSSISPYYSKTLRNGSINGEAYTTRNGSIKGEAYTTRNGSIKGEAYTTRNYSLDYIAGDRSMLYSPYSSSPYYFSPLSNSSSTLSQDIISPRASIAQSSTGSTISHASINSNNTFSHASISSHASSHASNASRSSGSSTLNPSNGPAMLANCLLSITSMSDEAPQEAAEDGAQSGSNPLSFASPELEILDEGLTTSYNLIRKPGTTMAEFINRGAPIMNRSISTSRVTFADDLYRKSPQKKYYSAQLNALAQPKTNFPSMQDPRCRALDQLFPLKSPNISKLSAKLASKYQSHESPDDRQAYADALDTSLDCSIMTDDGSINNMMASSPLERPAQEVVIQANDENGFAYSPVASAFVFSPRRSSQNSTANNYFKPSSRAHNYHNGNNNPHYAANGKPELKSILKKTGTNFSHELNVAPNYTTLGVPNDSIDDHMERKTLSHTGSQKISSVLLRFAEAEEQLYNSRRQHHAADDIRAPAACLPMCSFLGRAFLCRSKLATHGHLHE